MNRVPMTPVLSSLASLGLGLTLAVAPLPGSSSAALAAPAPAPAQDQAAAGRLPNTFDTPRASARAPTPTTTTTTTRTTTTTTTPAPAQAQAPAQASAAAAAGTEAEAADPARVAASEAMLRTTIASMQAGAPNYADMSDDLAEKVREQSAAITPLIGSFGALQSLAHVGVENGADLFLVGFENQITQWIIAMNEEDKIVALLFRPATPPAG